LSLEGKIIQWSKEKGQEDNQWSPNRRTDNTMVKRKRTRGTSDLQTEGQIIQWYHWLSSCPFSFDHCIILPSVWRSLVPLVLFLLTIVLSVLLFGDHWLSSCPFSFDHCIIWIHINTIWNDLRLLFNTFIWFQKSETLYEKEKCEEFP
jgi:hypothetical protein